MIARDGDDDSMRDPPRRAGRRDVLELGGRGARGGERSHPRDLDEEDEDDRRPLRRREADDEDDRPRNTRRRAEARDDDDGPRDRSRDPGRRREPRFEEEDDRGSRPAREEREGARNGNTAAADTEDTRQTKGGDKPAAAEDEETKSQNRRKSRRPVVIGIAAVVALLLIGGGIYYYLSHRGKASTDDAYTDGNVVSIAPQVSGQVISLDVNDNQFVHKGDPLFHIDPRQYVYSREQAKGTLDATTAQVSNQKLGVEIARKNFPASLQLAQANLAQSKANLLLQQANYERQRSLPKAATTQQDVDTATANYQQAQAQVDQAQARVAQAEPVPQNIGQAQEQVSQLQGQAEQAQGQYDQSNLNIEWTVVRAPQDGWVTRRNVNAGNYVSAGTQVMSLVTTDIWVTANFKETELNGMRPGQPVTISVDAYPDLALRGHVDSLQHGSGSRFSAFPAENATGNFVKIVQRVPVKIVIDSGLKPDEPLPLGISVQPTVMLQ